MRARSPTRTKPAFLGRNATLECLESLRTPSCLHIYYGTLFVPSAVAQCPMCFMVLTGHDSPSPMQRRSDSKRAQRGGGAPSGPARRARAWGAVRPEEEACGQVELWKQRFWRPLYSSALDVRRFGRSAESKERDCVGGLPGGSLRFLSVFCWRNSCCTGGQGACIYAESC